MTNRNWRIKIKYLHVSASMNFCSCQKFFVSDDRKIASTICPTSKAEKYLRLQFPAKKITFIVIAKYYLINFRIEIEIWFILVDIDSLHSIWTLYTNNHSRIVKKSRKVTWGHFWKILAVTCISGYIFKGQKWGHMFGSFEFFKDWITSFGITEMKSFFRQWSIIFETKFNFERVEQHPTKNNQSDHQLYLANEKSKSYVSLKLTQN